MIFQKGFRKNLSLLSLEEVMEGDGFIQNLLTKNVAYITAGGVSGMVSENLFSEKQLQF